MRRRQADREWRPLCSVKSVLDGGGELRYTCGDPIVRRAVAIAPASGWLHKTMLASLYAGTPANLAAVDLNFPEYFLLAMKLLRYTLVEGMYISQTGWAGDPPR